MSRLTFRSCSWVDLEQVGGRSGQHRGQEVSSVLHKIIKCSSRRQTPNIVSGEVPRSKPHDKAKT